MTKRTAPSNRHSILSIRENQPAISSSTSTAISPAEDKDFEFISADMDLPRATHRACASCIANLTPAEIGHANWHLASSRDCMQCSRGTANPEAYTKPFCDFLQENPTVFHAADYFARKLRAGSFQEVHS